MSVVELRGVQMSAADEAAREALAQLEAEEAKLKAPNYSFSNLGQEQETVEEKMDKIRAGYDRIQACRRGMWVDGDCRHGADGECGGRLFPSFCD